jgi:NAD(P)-dependent dehydrogenase (short-subunit alcohol dehydrogenase family)
MNLGIEGRAAIVTGASRGIGRAVAKALVREGAHVLLCGRDTENLDTAAKDIGHDAQVMTVDVETPTAADAIVAECVRVFGRIDILVNNAGGTKPMYLSQLQAEDWQKSFEWNFFSAARLSVAAANAMKERGWGRIVHNSSIDGVEADKTLAPYSAAKAAMLNLSKSLSQEYARYGVLSNSVVPGITLTESVMENAQAAAERAESTVDEVMERMLGRMRIAIKRMAHPEEVADAIVFLASERASFITGATLAIDGGTLRGI